MSGASYLKHMAEDRRLSILLLMAASQGGAANEALLQAALPDYGHEASLDQVRADLAWLAEQGLVETRDLHGLTVGHILARGEDAAAGRATIPGVKRPVRR